MLAGFDNLFLDVSSAVAFPIRFTNIRLQWRLLLKLWNTHFEDQKLFFQCKSALKVFLQGGSPASRGVHLATLFGRRIYETKEKYERLRAARRKADPDGVLTPNTFCVKR